MMAKCLLAKCPLAKCPLANCTRFLLGILYMNSITHAFIASQLEPTMEAIALQKKDYPLVYLPI